MTNEEIKAVKETCKESPDKAHSAGLVLRLIEVIEGKSKPVKKDKKQMFKSEY